MKYKPFTPHKPAQTKRRPSAKAADAPKRAPKESNARVLDGKMRLNKFLSTAGVCSRRKADELILEGKVKVNGEKVMSLGAKIDPKRDRVYFNEKQVVILDEPVYILFNKPKDCITTLSDEKGRTTILDYVKTKERVYPVGRLDRDTTGVLLLTNDGEFANGLMHPRHEVLKAYKALLDKPLAQEHAQQIRKGIRLFDGKTEPAEVQYLAGPKKAEVGIIIHEGKNRQIHRMFESLGYTVAKLERVAYAGITTSGLKRGEWRYVTKGELRGLRAAAGITREEELSF